MKDTSGPAFPETTPDGWGSFGTSGGMTVRQYFIGQAMLTAPGNAYEHEENAKWAIAYADAVIREMEK